MCGYSTILNIVNLRSQSGALLKEQQKEEMLDCLLYNVTKREVTSLNTLLLWWL